MIYSILSIFRHFIGFLTTHFQKYIHSRMEGLPYFFESSSSRLSYDGCSSPDNPHCYSRTKRSYNEVQDDDRSFVGELNMPSYMQEGIGKYGNEIYGNLQIDNTDAIETLHQYIETLDLPTYKTFHTFEDYLPPLEHTALQHIKYSDLCKNISLAHPKHILTPIVAMNELYVSCIGADGSDRVFETPHIDGLFAWLPWCTVYRAVVSIQGNRQVDTVFPLSRHKYTLETGDYVAFDYNRSIHYIVGNGNRQDGTIIDDRKRIVLKLHYLVYPEWLPVWISRVYVSIHGNYNAFLRGLFLKSQTTMVSDSPTLEKEPETITQRWISAFINHGTTFYVKIFLIGLYLGEHRSEART